MLRSILMLPDPEIPIKIAKNQQKQFSKISNFLKSMTINLYMVFHAEFESRSKIGRKSIQNQILTILSIIFFSFLGRRQPRQRLK